MFVLHVGLGSQSQTRGRLPDIRSGRADRTSQLVRCSAAKRAISPRSPGRSSKSDCYADLGMWEQAATNCEQAIHIADEIGFAQVRSEGRLSLATVQLQPTNSTRHSRRCRQRAPTTTRPQQLRWR